MRNSLAISVAMIFPACLLGACGQTGALYLPDAGVTTPVEIRNTQTATPPTPAPPAAPGESAGAAAPAAPTAEPQEKGRDEEQPAPPPG